MYTFLIAVLIFAGLSAIIFGKNIKENIFGVILIIFIGTFVSTTIVNGVLSSKCKTTKTVLIRSKVLEINEKIDINDTIFNLKINDSTSIKYFYIGLNADFDKKSKKYITNLSVRGDNRTFYSCDSTLFDIKFLPKGDSIPRINKYKTFKVSNSKWFSTFGIPKVNKHWTIYIPNDSINRELVKLVNKYYHNK